MSTACGGLEVDYYTDEWKFHAVLMVHVVFSLSTTVVCILCLHQLLNNYFHVNCKILIMALLFGYICHSLSMGGIQLYHLVTYQFFSGCDILVSSLVCLSFRGIATVCIFFFSFLHLTISLERVFAQLYASKYEETSKWFGIALVIISLLISTGIVVFIKSGMDLKTMHPYCSFGSQDTLDDTLVACCALLIVDVTSTLCLIGISVKGKQILKKLRTSVSFSLNSAYSAVEHSDTMSILLPLTLLHICFYIFFDTTNIWILRYGPRTFNDSVYKTIVAGLNCVPCYTLISSLIFLNRIKRLRICRVEKIKKAIKPITDAQQIHMTYANQW